MGKTIYFTLTGTQFRYGSDFMEKGMKIKLVKEPDNQYDSEAIRCEMEGFGQVGYVANSIRTIIGESYSAGRLYDHFKKKAKGKVVCVTERGVLCKLSGKKGGKKDKFIETPPTVDDKLQGTI